MSPYIILILLLLIIAAGFTLGMAINPRATRKWSVRILLLVTACMLYISYKDKKFFDTPFVTKGEKICVQRVAVAAPVAVDPLGQPSCLRWHQLYKVEPGSLGTLLSVLIAGTCVWMLWDDRRKKGSA